jgi:hypothetical protein
MTVLSSYLLASRQGLYLVDRQGWRLLREGRFFGIVCLGRQVFAFLDESADLEHRGENRGRIVRFEWDGDSLGEATTIVDGLDHNCHQIDFFDDGFFVVDTFRQRILEYDSGWRPKIAHQILPEAPRNGPDHAHLNSIAAGPETIYLMLHNGHRGMPSEIVEFDRRFRERRRMTLPCAGCHDIVPLPGGGLLTCLSPRGQIALESGPAFEIDQYLTRGLAVGPDEIAVGSSLYGARIERALLPGFVTFLDPEYRRIGRIYVPAAPTQIRRLDFTPPARG